MKNLKILVVDDEKTFREGMEVFLITQGYSNVQTAADGADAVEKVRQDPPDVVLLDLFMPGMNGLQVMKALHVMRPNLPIFVVSCEADEEYKKITMHLGAYDYLTKPMALSKMFTQIETRLKQRLSQPQ